MTSILTEAPAPQAMTPGCSLNIKEILVAVDLSSHSEETVSYAVSLAKPFGAHLSLVHVSSPGQSAEATGKKDNRFEEPVLVAEEKLENLARKIRRTYLNCSAHLCVGDAADKVALMADILHADLILVGSHDQSFFGRLFGIDEAVGILHQAPCPVLVHHDSDQRTS